MNVEVHHEGSGAVQDGWQLWFQWCTYHYDGKPQNVAADQDGYRFIWRRPNGKLAATRGQARLPSARQIFDLMRKAAEAGWLGVVEPDGKLVSPGSVPLLDE